jgi:uncharacterized membrane protein YoaK (UPF0700 family)
VPVVGSKSPQIPTSTESSIVAMSVSIQSVDYSIVTKLMPSVLSVIAGCVDVISFLGLGVFTAHITGNLVILAVHLVTGGGDARLAAMLSVPVFMLVVGMTRLLTAGLEAIGIASLRPLLAMQFLLLLGFLILSVGPGPRLDQHAARAIVAGMLTVAAMAVQNVIPQMSLIGAPTTAVMTSNVMRLTMDLGEILFGRDPEDVTRARQRASRGPIISCRSFASTCMSRIRHASSATATPVTGRSAYRARGASDQSVINVTPNAW